MQIDAMENGEIDLRGMCSDVHDAVSVQLLEILFEAVLVEFGGTHVLEVIFCPARLRPSVIVVMKTALMTAMP